MILQEALITITGRVQGVGYRAWAQHQAVKMGVCGYVKNTPDDAVEILAQADEKTLKEFIAKCKEGPATGKVEKVKVEKREITQKYAGFAMKQSEGFAYFAE